MQSSSQVRRCVQRERPLLKDIGDIGMHACCLLGVMDVTALVAHIENQVKKVPCENHPDDELEICLSA